MINWLSISLIGLKFWSVKLTTNSVKFPSLIDVQFKFDGWISIKSPKPDIPCVKQYKKSLGFDKTFFARLHRTATDDTGVITGQFWDKNFCWILDGVSG